MKRKPRQKGKVGAIVRIFLLCIFTAGLFSAAFFGVSVVYPIVYEAQVLISAVEKVALLDTVVLEEKVIRPIRIKTPEAVKAIYMTQCVAGTPSFREKLVRLVETTEINSIIIDVKDYSGGLGYGKGLFKLICFICLPTAMTR